DDLVALGQPEPGEHDVAGVRRRADERDVLGRRLQHRGERLARTLPKRQHLLEVRLAAAAVLEVAAVPFRNCLHRHARERAVCAGVQVGEALEDRELRPRLLEDHPIVASTGVWAERGRPSSRRRSGCQRTAPSSEAPRTRIRSIPLTPTAAKPHSPSISSAWVAERDGGTLKSPAAPPTRPGPAKPPRN